MQFRQLPGGQTLKKMFLSAAIAASLIAGTGVAMAEPPKDPGREYGLCTAFFNGQKKGHDKQKAKEDGAFPGPFQGLDENNPDGNDAGEDNISEIYSYCQQFGIGGNGEHGRFDECFDGDSTDDNDTDPCND